VQKDGISMPPLLSSSPLKAKVPGLFITNKKKKVYSVTQTAHPCIENANVCN